MKLLVFYVTESHLNTVKNSIFSAGGGAYEDFKNCSWEVVGKGQYQEGKAPLTKNKEYKVEILCKKNIIDAVIEALKLTHPCKSPPYYIITADQ
jgi:hypothetical protein